MTVEVCLVRHGTRVSTDYDTVQHGTRVSTVYGSVQHSSLSGSVRYTNVQIINLWHKYRYDDYIISVKKRDTQNNDNPTLYQAAVLNKTPPSPVLLHNIIVIMLGKLKTISKWWALSGCCDDSFLLNSIQCWICR